MNRSRCKNTYFNVKREYFQNLNIKSINDNKTFWKTVKPFFSDKGNKDQRKIILDENNEIIRDDIKNASTMNDYFVDITKNLDIPEIEIEQLPLNTDIVCINPIDTILYRYKNHPSILNISEMSYIQRHSLLVK